MNGDFFLYQMSRIVILLVFVTMIYANEEPYVKHEHLTTTDGLVSNTIECIYQDRQGYIWIGTQDGFSRYDGYSFINYKHDPNDSRTLSDNIVYHIFNTGRYFWLGTAGKLNRFDSFTKEFKTLPVYSVSSIVSDSAGILWVGSLFYGLYGIDEQMHIVYHLTKENSAIGSDNIRDLLVDANGDLWVCTEGGGVTRISFREETLKYVSFRHDAHNCFASDGTGLLGM